jgi:hypothetical protein
MRIMNDGIKVQKVVLDVDKIATRARELALEHAKSIKDISIGTTDSWLKAAMTFLTIHEAVMEESIKQSKKTQE